jgi:hypothetical protein
MVRFAFVFVPPHFMLGMPNAMIGQILYEEKSSLLEQVFFRRFSFFVFLFFFLGLSCGQVEAWFSNHRYIAFIF